MRRDKNYRSHLGNDGRTFRKGTVGLAAAVLLTLAFFPETVVQAAQATGGDAQPPLSDAAAARLNDRIAAAEALPSDLPSQIVSEIFTGNIVGIVGDNAVKVHRDDKDSDQTIYLYGVRSFGAAAASDGKTARAYLLEHLKDAHVRVDGRSRDRSGKLFAFVTDMPRAAASTLSMQTIDGSGANRDFPQGVGAPSIVPPSSAPTVNYALIRLGLARADNSRQSVSAGIDLTGAETMARKEKKGYWAAAPDPAAGGAAL